MFIAAHEWSRPTESSSDITSALDQLVGAPTVKKSTGELPTLYRELSSGKPSDSSKQRAATYLRDQIVAIQLSDCGLPDTPQELESWMHTSAKIATAKYSAYLEERNAGAPRRLFTNRAHALYFIRTVSPTKLVDGAWLYGLVPHSRNPRFNDLLRVYLEELGEGEPGKNHVVLYRHLLAQHGLEPALELEDKFYAQGVIQLALAFNAEEFLPEVIGFNLGYEQLPLHLLITAYELNELGLDPYYFTLHVTVDNPDTGHAKRAVQAVMDNLPQIGDAGDFWRRVKNGAKLGDAGVGTTEVIAGFNIEQEVIRIFSQKSHAGHGAHSDYCRVAGKSINDWLSDPDAVSEFLQALQAAGWIQLGKPVSESRFWSLLQGDRAEMFGVFSGYELQLIHDWIRGVDSADGRNYADPGANARQPSFRVAARLAVARGENFGSDVPVETLLDVDLKAFKNAWSAGTESQRSALMVDAMAPSGHWTPAGLYATQLFCKTYL